MEHYCPGLDGIYGSWYNYVYLTSQAKQYKVEIFYNINGNIIVTSTQAGL